MLKEYEEELETNKKATVVAQAEPAEERSVEVFVGDDVILIPAKRKISKFPVEHLDEETGYQDNVENAPKDEEIEDLVPIKQDSEEPLEDENEPKKLKIIEKKREKGLVERRRTIALILTAAGAMATTVLAIIYKINPVVAAKNCWGALSGFDLGAISLGQLLPTMQQATALFATVAGGISALVFHKKKKKVAKELAELEDLEEVEELGRSL
jgi:hypothetical protein